MTVTSEITGATSATFVWYVGRTRGTGTMTLLSGSTWRGTSPQDLFTLAVPEGPITVEVTATGAGGSTTTTATGLVKTCKP